MYLAQNHLKTDILMQEFKWTLGAGWWSLSKEKQIQSTFKFETLTNQSRNNWFDWSDWLNID